MNAGIFGYQRDAAEDEKHGLSFLTTSQSSLQFESLSLVGIDFLQIRSALHMPDQIENYSWPTPPLCSSLLLSAHISRAGMLQVSFSLAMHAIGQLACFFILQRFYTGR